MIDSGAIGCMSGFSGEGPRLRQTRIAWRELGGARRRPRAWIGTLGGETVTNEFTLTQTQTQPSPGMLAFADADGCTAWLRAVPLTNIPRYYNTILGPLKRLAEADFAPRERARIAEVMREPVTFLHTELARRYAGKPQ